MSPIDFEVLDAAISYATAHPDELDMNFWFRRDSCGTTACLAGTIAVQAGYRPVWPGCETVWHDGTTFYIATHVQLPDGPKDAVWNVAGWLLGLDPDVDGVLLDELFTVAGIDDVIQIRNRLARRAGVAQRTWDLLTAVAS